MRHQTQQQNHQRIGTQRDAHIHTGINRCRVFSFIKIHQLDNSQIVKSPYDGKYHRNNG
ncbi:hypothetical protein THIOM_000136 [Candidatus Thiomargarita nelsonii]|uniref:Uncharacterized protein n=1 Tax=Candidatus Thiomargarita nelsonii TaxID=1003181 RepID=A0A176S7R3_9GAMM|nr:hypothetical protein THIOM_000136 [Candidatus Thiomargarita nelsonii]